jgi:hypothetical protein
VEGHRDCLYRNFSPLKYDTPFYYGLFGTHIWILMFDRADGIRFSHSPSGGGDFQFLVPKYDVMTDYGFRARMIYRERCSRAEVVKAYEQWRAGLDDEP